ncbi:hypothetical protein SAMN05216496_4941 [Pseudomonas sp. Z003-0.4C(8344-21)]|uniref:hypothetical protein n=1 Tax=Pseudomonas TaxID=286 RepID=UPI000879EE64|nr:hypothetical protein [Pseudomonas sp. Z003-0.4C(8344-21)]SDT49988.1 hypothetical protein SAMN05216496_4941 [Pseudomonas sp. Z003-0.4C(8344-21)]
MSTKDLKLDKLKKSGKGTVSAKLNKDYVTDKFEGTPDHFVTDNTVVALQATYQKTTTTSFTIHLEFDANIQHGRHEFSTTHFPSPFRFSYTSGSHTKGYTSAKNAGFIVVEEFNIAEGLFKASFNFTFMDFDTGELHQVHDGHIDVQGLEIIEG